MRNQSRVVIENIHPQLDGGNHPIKATVEEIIPVTADVLCDGHDIIAASLLYKHENERIWKAEPMSQAENNVWQASFLVEKQGIYYLKHAMLEKAVYELGYEMNSRPLWAVIPLEGIASIMNED